MKKNDLIQIKGMDLKELRLKVKTIKQEIADLVLDKNMKKLKNVKAISNKRKDIAQILTVMKQKQTLGQLESRVESPAEGEVRQGRQESSENAKEPVKKERKSK